MTERTLPHGREQAEGIGTPRKTKELLQKHGFSFKKSLGQNFLIDANILRNIAEAAELGPKKGALEIGPGIGALTEKLAERSGRVVAIEIDQRLLPMLEESLADYPNVSIVHGDVLKVDLRALFRERFAGLEGVSVVANLPYYITTPIVMRLLEERLPVESIVVMIQKEVADRFSAAPGSKDYGSLSVAVQYYAVPDIVAKVPRTVFIPQPNVDSSVVRLKMREKPPVQVYDEARFFEVVQAAFVQRRKTLLNNLQQRFFPTAGGKEECRAFLEGCGIAPERRGETLTLAEFAIIANALGARPLPSA
ncbi:16S rRNA (adenine(1518)-N(6)/adenine(1519)-N(6))-dimethyltransferase RsmA [Paenibacillus sp.]|uniref:16S rRNA (adenine(1518)-N(6)/adenine(1519)-N(6))- dimethyltransferase RsmA n=1 Tax=Paenibacillus sp. TaxID=58172 RepID=UPI002D39DE4C|nr:16S rRNA (adenine(1518)-N(6)/adenine(1519)-N(6))-dimethyltransferase RsmA [Paenibacillus sp.]HZG55815.1 16S rRNA (adenine(1518)-N(6)/adenine(1519)-N(6))-dimethyltransferase RsmA [Paenibacillus sp.]